MKEFMLSNLEISKLELEYAGISNESTDIYNAYCPGCSNSGCTGSAQVGCSSCSSCSDWAKSKGNM